MTGAPERGSAMVMALVFVAVVALVVSSLLTLTMANLRTTPIVRSYTERTYAVDAALEHAIKRIELDRTLCGPASPEAEGIGDVTIDVDGTGGTDPVSVDLACELVGDGGASGNDGWAVIVGELEIQSGGEKRIVGPVWIDGDFVHSGGDVTVEGGSVYRRSANCPDAPPGPEDGLVEDPAGSLFGPRCATGAAPVPSHDLPTATMPVRDGTPATTSTGSCRVFLPGRYTAAPQLAAGDNYFVSGDYYFGDGISLAVSNGVTLVGGAPPAGIVPAIGGCANDPAGTTGQGVRFLFGGAAGAIRLEVQNNGDLELFPRIAAGEGAQGMSIQSVTEVPATNPNSFAAVPAGQSLFAVATGSTPRAFVHGRLHGPTSDVELNPQNTAEVWLRGGVVAQRLLVQTGNTDPSNFVIGAVTSPLLREVEVTARAAGEVGAAAIVGTVALVFANDGARTFRIDSWVTGRGA